MDDNEYRRLRRLLIISWALLLGFMVVITFWGSAQIRILKSQLQKPVEVVQVEPKNGINGHTPVKGVDYFDGSAGINGHNGTNGKDSMSTATIVQQPLYTNISVPGPQGEEGPEGPPGSTGLPGRIVFVRDNAGTLECRFNGDVAWQPLSECE